MKWHVIELPGDMFAVARGEQRWRGVYSSRAWAQAQAERLNASLAGLEACSR